MNQEKKEFLKGNSIRIVLIGAVVLIVIFALYLFFNKQETYLPVEVDQENPTEEDQEEPIEINETLKEPSGFLFQNLEEVIAQLKTPQDLLKYLQSDFKFESREGGVVSPADFLKEKKGGEQDFSAFTSHVLYHNNIFATVFVYQYLDKKGAEKTRYLSVFNNMGTPGYIYFDKGMGLVADYGRNSLELCMEEQERTGFKITKYALLPALSENLTVKKWSDFDY
jgi:hypothetical protein